MSILITGGAGYIGSHTVIALQNYVGEIIIVDNFSNASWKVKSRLQELTGKNINIIEADIRDMDALRKIFDTYHIKEIIHFAGLKSVSESVMSPLKYYDNNVSGTNNLLTCMVDYQVDKFIFSSSATVYGPPEYIPLDEVARTGETTNPYGTSKYFCELMLKDFSAAFPDKIIINLRYFNPVGAHPSGLIGEDPSGIPNNLIPYIYQVAIGRLPFVKVFGSNYPTKDGTGVRDYIHVMDLADGHVAALNKCNLPGFYCYNLGTGKGYSVSEIISAFERISGKKLDVIYSERRSGDVAECWSNPEKALLELGWKATKGLDQMLSDGWNWQLKNPNGYSE